MFNENDSKTYVEKIKAFFDKILTKLGAGEVENLFVLIFSVVLTTSIIFMLGLVKMLLIILFSFLVALVATGKFNPLFTSFFKKIGFKGKES